MSVNLKKGISMLIVFVMVFTYMGQPLEVLATTGGINSFFGNSNVEFASYFEKDGKQSSESTNDVKEKTTLTLEVSPQNVGDGFIKEGVIEANNIASENDINFKFSKIVDIDVIEDDGENIQNNQEEKNGLDNEVENKITNEVENKVTNKIENTMVENIQKNNTTVTNEIQINNKEENDLDKEKANQENVDKQNENSEESYEQLINEEEVIENILKEEIEEEETLSEHQIEITSDNKIELKNILNKTIIKVEIEYNSEEIDTSNLSQEIELVFNGKYVDLNLNEKEISVSNHINVIWLYEEEQKEVISEEQEIKVENGGSVSYTVSTDDAPISKGRINANYNSEEVMYETEFTNNVNLNITTLNSSYEEIRVNLIKESYFDAKGTAFETDDVYYKKIKFNQNDINEIISSGGRIDICDKSENVLHTVESLDNNEILLNNQKGIIIVFRNITISKDINIELTKAIGKSNYDKASFNTFREIESTVSATAKQVEDENRNELPEISVRKTLKSSSTIANISLNNNNFATINTNENVELKVTLNNETEDSDLYINPSFEIVFPEYVTDVKVQNINVTYAEGLRIRDFQTYKEDNIVKMRINLVGVQSKFSSSTLTHGTNILITSNITVDEYAPNKKDQIKMYYCNEGVTNYTSQTKWTIDEELPSGILRETNGFDAVIVNYAAPSGLVTATSIVNYDGKLGNIKSIKQGEKVAKIDRESNAKVATMELYVANNTGDKANNVVLLGRVPFKDNTNVITKESLGTTIDTRMLSRIREESNSNENSMVIYYSYNGNATSDLSNENNGWTENPESLVNVKSYMIVVDGELEPEAILKLNYDFQIPAKLGFDTAIYGSFGANYNNGETAIADKVGLQTEVSIPITMELKSDIAENIGVGEGRFINYTLTVTSNSNDTLYDIDIMNSLPEGTTFYEKSNGIYQGDNGFTETNATEMNWVIDELKPNGTYVKEYTVKVNPEMAGKTVTSTSYASMGDMEQKSNSLELKVFENSLDIEVSKSTEDSIAVGSMLTYRVKVTNISGKTEKNIKLNCTNPKEVTVNSLMIGLDELEYTENDNTLNYTIDELSVGESREFFITCTATEANSKGVTAQISFELEDGKIEKGSEVNFKIKEADLKVSQSANIELNTIKAGDEIELTLMITNNSQHNIYDLNIINDLSDFLEPSKLRTSSEGSSSSITLEGNDIKESTYILSGETLKMTIVATVKEDSEGQVIHNRWKITGDNMDDLNTDEMLITIVNSDDEVNLKGEETNAGIYSISGKTWIDVDGNGIKDEEDIEGVQAEVQLLKDGKVVQSMNTNETGDYAFNNLDIGEYIIVTNYEKDIYETTSYEPDLTKNDVSNVYEAEKGTAVTDSINITNSNVENLNIGFVEKERFDFEISQSIVKATVIRNGKETEYEYYDLDLAKLELTSKELKNANIKLEYKIRVTNVGNIDGKVSKIVNYIPNGMTFDKEDNPFWEQDDSGKLYYSGLKDTTIRVDDFQDVILTLSKQLSQDNNVGIINSKSGIVSAESDVKIVEAKSNNFTSQQTIITTTSKSKGLKIIIPIAVIGVVGIYVYMVEVGIIDYKKLKKKKMQK